MCNTVFDRTQANCPVGEVSSYRADSCVKTCSLKFNFSGLKLVQNAHEMTRNNLQVSITLWNEPVFKPFLDTAIEPPPEVSLAEELHETQQNRKNSIA